MESKAYIRLHNHLLLDLGYKVRKLSEDSMEVTFTKDEKAEVIVKERDASPE